MGYGEVIIGDLIREKIVGGREEEWRERLRDDHDLTDEELDHLEPYIEYVSHYGSKTEAIVLTLLFVPFALVLLALAVFFGGTTLAVAAAALTGSSVRSLGAIGLAMGVVALLPLLLVGVIVYVLYRRWKRYRLATEVREYLASEPRRLCREDDPLPRSREEIADMSKTTFADS